MWFPVDPEADWKTSPQGGTAGYIWNHLHIFSPIWGDRRDGWLHGGPTDPNAPFSQTKVLGRTRLDPMRMEVIK
jgi:hypothetical protein